MVQPQSWFPNDLRSRAKELFACGNGRFATRTHVGFKSSDRFRKSISRLPEQAGSASVEESMHALDEGSSIPEADRSNGL